MSLSLLCGVMKREPLLFLYPKSLFTVLALALACFSTNAKTSIQDYSRAGRDKTALDEYVYAPDTNYSFHVITNTPGKDYTAFLLEMTSQSWLTTNEVNRTLWRHWLTITRPDTVNSSTSLLFIGGGSNEKEAPKEADANMIKVALSTKSVVTELKMVPNQPLVFKGDGEKRSEDAL